MTQIFDTEGKFGAKGTVVPVTVIEAGPCVVTQIKTEGVDGYAAVQVAFEDIKKNRTNKPQAGHFKKAGVTPKRILREFRVTTQGAELKVGDVITCDMFSAGDLVDVTARTKGRGFTGVIKRWNQRRQPMSHGCSVTHRAPGSMGANSFPSRVFPGKKLAGQYGNEQVTISNLTIVKVDKEKNCLLVKGGVPGPEGALVSIRTAVKGGAK